MMHFPYVYVLVEELGYEEDYRNDILSVHSTLAGAKKRGSALAWSEEQTKKPRWDRPSTQFWWRLPGQDASYSSYRITRMEKLP